MWPAIAEPVSALKIVIHMCSAAATVDLTYMWIIMHSPENSYKVYNANGTPQKHVEEENELPWEDLNLDLLSTMFSRDVLSTELLR